MDRRDFFKAGAAMTIGAAAAGLPDSEASANATQRLRNFRLFEVTTTVDLAKPEAGMQLWLPMLQSAGGYQKVLSSRWESEADVQLVSDRLYGASVLHARWPRGDVPQRLSLVQQVATWDRAREEPSSTATLAEREFWTRPETRSDPVVRQKAMQIVGATEDPKLRARKIYDWIVATTWRDPAVPGCGTGDVAGMLQEERFGGKCVDINALMVGLCRAAGIPARETYGIRLAGSARYKSLGRSGGDVTTAQHCRAEVYFEDTGWFPVDPADVRKAVLEEKLPVDSAQITQLADELFGSWEGNWGSYNSATGLKLATPRQPQFSFLMYPCAMSDKSSPACLEPEKFAYRIASREV